MCGIVAYTGRTKPDWNILKFATVLQKHRGTHGTGFLFNNEVHRGYYEGVGKDHSDPYNYFKGIYFPSLYTTKFTTNTVIIHNRAMSKGHVAKDQIHPWEFETTNEDGSIVKHFFAHNGTLENEDEMLREYGLNPKDFKTDSHALGHLIVNFGFEEIIPKYIGAAVIVYCRSDEPNTLYVWKGASRQKTDVIEEERPLFYIQTKQGVYFASELSTLQCTFDGATSLIVDFPKNTLMKIDYSSKDVIVTEDIIDRSHIQKQVTTHFTQTYFQRTGGQEKITLDTINCTSALSEVKHIANVIKPSGTKVYYARGLYWKNGHLLTSNTEAGTVVNPDGTSAIGTWNHVENKYDYPEETIRLWFYHGLMLKDKDAYLEIAKRFKTRKEIANNYGEVTKYLHDKHVLFYYTSTGALRVWGRGAWCVYTEYFTMIPFAYMSYTFYMSTDKYTCFTKQVQEPYPIERSQSRSLFPYDLRNFPDNIIVEQPMEEFEKLTKEDLIVYRKFLEMQERLDEIRDAIRELYNDVTLDLPRIIDSEELNARVLFLQDVLDVLHYGPEFVEEFKQLMNINE